MSIIILLWVVGILSIGILVFAICQGVYIDLNAKSIEPVSRDEYNNNDLYCKAKKMLKLVRSGYFSLHVLSNNAPEFNDALYLSEYKTYIAKASTIEQLEKLVV